MVRREYREREYSHEAIRLEESTHREREREREREYSHEAIRLEESTERERERERESTVTTRLG